MIPIPIPTNLYSVHRSADDQVCRIKKREGQRNSQKKQIHSTNTNDANNKTKTKKPRAVQQVLEDDQMCRIKRGGTKELSIGANSFYQYK